MASPKRAAKAAEDQPEGAETAPESVAEETTETSAPSKDSVTVKFRGENGFPTERTFRKDVHGADFAKRAKEFSDNMQAQGRLEA